MIGADKERHCYDQSQAKGCKQYMSKVIAQVNYHRKASIPYKFMVRAHTLVLKLLMSSVGGATFGTPRSCSNFSLIEAEQFIGRDRLN